MGITVVITCDRIEIPRATAPTVLVYKLHTHLSTHEAVVQNEKKVVVSCHFSMKLDEMYLSFSPFYPTAILGGILE